MPESSIRHPAGKNKEMWENKMIIIKDVEAFGDSLKKGDELIYIEDAPRDDGIKGRTKIKRIMSVDKVYKHTVDLVQGKVKRNVTLKEAMICNMKQPAVPSVPVNRAEAREIRKNKIISMACQGLDQDEIVGRTGYSKGTIANVIRHTKQKGQKVAERNAQIIKLKQEGMHTKDIAKKLDCSKSLVCEVYKRYREKGI